MVAKNKKKFCPLCKQEEDPVTINIHTDAYAYVIERIKAEHPDWVEKDGACPKCIEYYTKL